MTVKLNSALPAGRENGLNSLTGDMVRDPSRFRVVIAVLDCKSITTESDSGEAVPTARIRHVEPVLRGDMPAARALMQRARESRTGQVALPLEMEEELRSAFEDLDA